MLEMLIAMLAFFWIIFGVFIIIRILTMRQQETLARLSQFVSDSHTQPAGITEKNVPEGSWRQRLDKWLTRDSLAKFVGGQARSKQLEQELIRAGLPLRAVEYNLIRLGLAIFCIIFGLLLQQLLLAALLGIVGYFAPQIYLRFQQQKLLHQFNRQLSDGISMMSNSLKAGYGFIQTLDMLAKEMPAPLGTAFAQTMHEINLGVATEQALLNMATRVKSEDLELIITAVLIQRQTGGNLAEILDNISATIRERVKIQGEIKTMTAQGRISGLIIALLPVLLALVMLIVDPNYLNLLFTRKAGLLMVGYAITAELIGALIIKKIVTIRF